NAIGLDAVLAHIKAQGGVDAYGFLGDYVGIGSDPIRVLETITNLPNTRFIRGNTDRYCTSSAKPPPFYEDVLENPSLAETFAHIRGNFSWTQGMITATGWFDWLANLPLEERIVLPDGTRVLLVHATPGHDDGQGLSPYDSE